MTGQPDLTDRFPEELAALLAPLGVPAFRGKQLFSWIHKRLATSFADMTDLPVSLREALTAQFSLTDLHQQQRAAAPDNTVKYLFALADGHTVETVYLPEATRATVCVSTMVGCPYGCAFCATGQSGFVRNLTAGEIVEQVYRVQAALPAEQRVTNVVYMGMGEPLGNYDAVLRSVRLLIHPLGLDLAQRHITLSTVGLTPGIDRLADEGLQVNLAISLHAPTQAGRVRWLPIARQYPLGGVMASARTFVHRTGRKVAFEYTVIPGGNDSEEDAKALGRLLRHLQCMVNIIPLSPTEGGVAGVQPSPGSALPAAEHFAEMLRALGLDAVVRRSRGQEITGACGQLRRRSPSGKASSQR